MQYIRNHPVELFTSNANVCGGRGWGGWVCVGGGARGLALIVFLQFLQYPKMRSRHMVSLRKAKPTQRTTRCGSKSRYAGRHILYLALDQLLYRMLCPRSNGIGSVSDVVWAGLLLVKVHGALHI